MTERISSSDRRLIERLADGIDALTSHGEVEPGRRLLLTVDVEHLEELAAEARARLAQEPAQAGVTDEELLDAYDELDLAESGDDSVIVRGLRAFLARYGAPPLRPVPVGERLPGPDDCDAEGRCWWWHNLENKWDLIDTRYRTKSELYYLTHWLSFHAMPLPGEVEA